MIPWVGGKCRLSPWIISHFPEDYTKRTYVEVFGGAGWVLFNKEPSKLDVYNDIRGDLVNLFKILRDNANEFKERAKWVLFSREMWKEAHEKVFKTLQLV